MLRERDGDEAWRRDRTAGVSLVPFLSPIVKSVQPTNHRLKGFPEFNTSSSLRPAASNQAATQL